VLLHLGHMFGIAAHAQQTAMHHGMQSFDPAVQHLGKSGVFGNILDLQTRITQQLGCSTGGKDFDPISCQHL